MPCLFGEEMKAFTVYSKTRKLCLKNAKNEESIGSKFSLQFKED